MNNPRYAPGGDIYAKLQAQYGTAAANKVYLASQSSETQAIARALEEVKYGPKLNTSTLSQLWNQITTDPLAAPLESANNQIGKTMGNIVKNPWVLAVVALAFVYMLWRMNILRFKTRFI